MVFLRLQECLEAQGVVEGTKCLCVEEHLCVEGVCRGGAHGCLVGDV